jgi:hypothetical protein
MNRSFIEVGGKIVSASGLNGCVAAAPLLVAMTSATGLVDAFSYPVRPYSIVIEVLP